MIVALYARVSTDGQDVDNQVDRLKEVAHARGYIVYDVFVDRASGADPKRPQLDKMMMAARYHDFDRILCTKLDRLARSTINLLKLMQDLDSYKVAVEFLDQPIDTGTAAGRMTITILGAMAEFERELIRDRTNDGLRRAAAEGRKGGRPQRHLSEYQLEKALDLLKMNPGMSMLELSKHFDGISRPTLVKCLKEEGVLIGRILNKNGRSWKIGDKENAEE